MQIAETELESLLELVAEGARSLGVFTAEELAVVTPPIDDASILERDDVVVVDAVESQALLSAAFRSLAARDLLAWDDEADAFGPTGSLGLVVGLRRSAGRAAVFERHSADGTERLVAYSVGRSGSLFMEQRSTPLGAYRFALRSPADELDAVAGFLQLTDGDAQGMSGDPVLVEVGLGEDLPLDDPRLEGLAATVEGLDAVIACAGSVILDSGGWTQDAEVVVLSSVFPPSWTVDWSGGGDDRRIATCRPVTADDGERLARRLLEGGLDQEQAAGRGVSSR